MLSKQVRRLAINIVGTRVSDINIDVGKQLGDVQKEIAEQMKLLEQEKKKLDKAWKSWDFDYLIDKGYITKKDADRLEDDMSQRSKDLGDLLFSRQSNISDYIGEKLDRVSQDYVKRLHTLREEQDSFEKAWKDWDLDYLVDAMYLTEQDAKDIEADMGKID